MTQPTKSKFFTFRIEPKLHELLKKEAEMHHRTIAGELHMILDLYFSKKSEK